MYPNQTATFRSTLIRVYNVKHLNRRQKQAKNKKIKIKNKKCNRKRCPRENNLFSFFEHKAPAKEHLKMLSA